MQTKLSQNAIISIIDRLKEALGVATDTELANALGVKQNTISTWRTRGTIDFALIISYCDRVDLNWLLLGQANREQDIQMAPLEVKETFKLKTDCKTIDRQTIPLYSYEASAGIVAVFADIKPAPVDYLSLPDLPPVDGAVYVRGDSMYPLLKSGDIVLYKMVSDMQYGIFWGEMYLVSANIDGEQYNTIKYVQKSDKDGFIKLVSHNPHHNPKEIPINMVQAMAIVKASVRYNTM